MHLSPADHLQTIRRSVTTVTRGPGDAGDGAERRLVTASRTFGTDADDLWQALTTPDRIARWLAPVTGDLVVGGRFQLEGHAGGDVLACDAPERLSLTWEFGEQVSYVDVTLRPTDGGTLLQLDHTVPVDDHYRQFGPGATGLGWEMMMMGVAEHLAAPAAPRPGPDDLPDLGGYLSEAGTAWGRAAVDGGADEEEATEAAARCVAAYTGA